MAFLPTKRQRLVAAVAVAAAAAGTVLMSAGDAGAATSTTVSITSIAPHVAPSGTKNVVLTVTGKGFDQNTMTGVTVNKCTTDPDFIVVNATTLVLKTTGTDCAAGAATVTITDASGTATNPAGTAGALTFAAPPTLVTVDSSHNAMMTDNTSGLAFADQALTAPIAGGTVVRVVAGSTPFVNSTATPLAASFAGVPMTGVTLGAGGAFFTGKLGAHAAGAGTLTVTSGGVAKSFTAAETDNFAYAGNTITVAPTSGPANGGNTLTITGSGFSSASTVKVGTVTCASPTATGTTKITCTVPKIAAGTSDGPEAVTVTTGAVTNVVSSSSIYTYLSR
jgi:hypothetical protein